VNKIRNSGLHKIHLMEDEISREPQVKAAAAGKLQGADSKIVTPEQMELSRLRAENIRLKRENDFLSGALTKADGRPAGMLSAQK
jgi:transposase-like protein